MRPSHASPRLFPSLLLQSVGRVLVSSVEIANDATDGGSSLQGGGRRKKSSL